MTNVQTIIYTEDEENDISELSASLINYMDEAQSRFIMGELSVEDDWDDFLATLDSIGIDHYLEVVQGDYDCTMDK